jgi:O-antigen biosynthesis protein
MPDLSIIIVNYNVKEFVRNLLESLRSASENISAEIIIVDNASDDGSVELIRDKYPDVKLIANKDNVGFGKANNMAMEIARGEFFLLINPDTIVREDTLVKMIGFMKQNENAGIAGCKVLNPDGTLQLACRRGFPGPWTSFTKVMGLSALFPGSKLFARYNLTYLDENKSYEVDAVSGAFMMMRKSVYDKIGGFDSQFFMYGEDLDLCYRTQKEGFKVFYFHETEIIHYKGESTKRSSIDETKVFYDAMHLFVRKHFSSSFLIETILQAAIIFRKLMAFLNIYRLVIASVFIDLSFFTSAVYIAEHYYANEHWIGFPGYSKPWVYLFPALIQAIISFSAFAYKKNSVSVLRSVVSLFYGMIILSALTYFFKQFAFSRAVVLITYLISLFAFSFWRIFVKAFFKIGIETDSSNSRVLIVADPKNGKELSEKVKSNISKLHRVVGLISLSRKDIGEKFGSLHVLGSVDNLKKVILDEKIDKVIFSSDGISYDQMFAHVVDCQGLNVEFLVAGKEMDYMVGKSSITMLEDIPLLKVQYNISSLRYRFSKRVFDIILSVILIAGYPFLLLLKNFANEKRDYLKFINGIAQVLLGSKSFVGPADSSYSNELYIGKNGLTGFWFTESINDTNESKKLDIFYAKNQNVWLDLEILGKSFSKVFLSRR